MTGVQQLLVNGELLSQSTHCASTPVWVPPAVQRGQTPPHLLLHMPSTCKLNCKSRLQLQLNCKFRPHMFYSHFLLCYWHNTIHTRGPKYQKTCHLHECKSKHYYNFCSIKNKKSISGLISVDNGFRCHIKQSISKKMKCLLGYAAWKCMNKFNFGKS